MFVFIDESGSFDGSPRSSRYAILTSVRIKNRATLTQVTKILKKGYATKARPKGLRSLPEIKASQANPQLLHYIYRGIALMELTVSYVALDTHLPAFGQTHADTLYTYGLLLLAARVYPTPAPSELYCYIDRRSFHYKQLKQHILGILRNPPFGQFAQSRTSADFYPSSEHKGLQLADYCAYAVSQKYERGNTEWYEMIRERIQL